MSKPADQLKAVFGPAEEAMFSTGAVLTRPTDAMREIASQAIQSIDLSILLRDIGIIVAREIGSELERMALRPADYSDLEDMPQMVAARLGAELSKAPTQFVEALIEQLQLRG